MSTLSCNATGMCKRIFRFRNSNKSKRHRNKDIQWQTFNPAMKTKLTSSSSAIRSHSVIAPPTIFLSCAPLVTLMRRSSPWPEWMYQRAERRETSWGSQQRMEWQRIVAVSREKSVQHVWSMNCLRVIESHSRALGAFQGASTGTWEVTDNKNVHLELVTIVQWVKLLKNHSEVRGSIPSTDVGKNLTLNILESHPFPWCFCIAANCPT